jgi:mannose/fructose/N-acetylgalactosamine-specific phosphotransferase system component IIC
MEKSQTTTSSSGASKGNYRVPTWIARLEQAILVLLGVFLVALGLAQVLSSMLTKNMPQFFSIGLGAGIIAVGAAVCWRMLQKRTFHLLRNGELSLLHFILG